jgi:ribose 5-phosphate isomerase RpiB
MPKTRSAASLSGPITGCIAEKNAVQYLELLKYRVVDVGCFGTDKVDYPDIAQAVCKKVISGDCDRGIVLDEPA